MDDVLTFTTYVESQEENDNGQPADSDTIGEVVENKPVYAKFHFTKEQRTDLLMAFNLLDYSGEGKILAEDFRVAIKALGYEPTKEELQNMVNGVDKGYSGKLSFENFQTAIMRKIMALDTDADIMKSFRLFDMSDAGFINFENVKAVTEILDYYLTDEEIEEMIDDADRDFDGLEAAERAKTERFQAITEEDWKNSC